jgi:hypothetical protein
MRHAVRFVPLVFVLGCRGGNEPVPEDLVKLTPASVSSDEAWALFDRDMTTGFVPSSEPIEIAFERDQAFAAFRVFGSSPYRVTLTDKLGASIGIEPIDLSDLGTGWHRFTATVTSSARSIVVRFDALGAPAPIPEIELWATGSHVSSPVQAWPIGDGLVAAASSNASVVLSRSLCAAFPIALARPPAVLRRGYLVYETDGALRSFELKRSINGGIPQGGSWLGGDPSHRTQVDQIDLAQLHRGANEIVLCASDEATRDIAVSNLRFVGELDQGAPIVESIAIDGHAVDALLDADSATSAAIGARAPIVIAFDRLIAPELVRLDGAQVDDAAASCSGRSRAIECEGLGRWTRDLRPARRWWAGVRAARARAR